MVGKRTWAAPGQGQNGYGGHEEANGAAATNGNMDHDREYAKHTGQRRRRKSKPALMRFRDNANRALEDQRREEIKNKLIDEVNREQFEEYRKSDEFIKQCKTKKLKRFYERQNEALNDWLEVDTAVRSIADDIFESFDPDADHDGIPERGGALQNLGEDVEAFLPEEEREARRKANKKAKWAINVGRIVYRCVVAVG